MRMTKSNMSQFDTPILLIIFNRPDKVRQLIKALEVVKPTNVYISADGPRSDVPSDIKKCNETRQVINEISWTCNVFTNFLDKNLGVDKGMEEAMNWFYSNVDEGIVCEDDCIPNQDFFNFCSILLERYRFNEKVMLISGTNVQDGIVRGTGSYYFSHYPAWGYAMWKRTWDKFDSNLNGLDSFIQNNKIDTILNDPQQKKYWINFFKKIRNKKFNFTDTRLLFSIWNNGGLVIIPNKNLVKNIGFDIEATHSTFGGKERSIDSSSIGDMQFNDIIKVDEDADNYLFEKIYKISFFKKVFSKILQLMTKIIKYGLEHTQSKN